MMKFRKKTVVINTIHMKENNLKLRYYFQSHGTMFLLLFFFHQSFCHWFYSSFFIICIIRGSCFIYFLGVYLRILVTHSNMTGTISGVGNDYPSKAPEFNHGFQWGSCRSVFCFLCSVLYCLSFFFWSLYYLPFYIYNL